jgi:hypothetical protein
MENIVCGAYARYSHDDGDDSESVALQVQRAHEVAKAHGWLLEPSFIFVDDGFSGREMKRRSGFTACLKAVERQAFPVLVSKDLDRCARGEVFAVGHFLQTLHDNDVRLFEYLRNGFLRIDGENALMAAFRAYANRAEALKASERIKDKLHARDEANDGWTSRAPFGFQNVRRRLSDGKLGIFLDRKGTIGAIERHPEKFPVLLLMGELFLELQTFNAVAMELNRRKIPTPEGGPFWSSRSVSSILQAQVYRGKVVRGRMTSQDKGGTLKVVPAAPGAARVYDRPELQVWEGEKLAKIDALATVRSITKARGPMERRHLSSGAVRCAHCGGGLAISIGGKKKYTSYTCANAAAGGCRTLGYRPEQLVDANVIMACGMLLTDEVLTRTKEIVREAFDAKSKADARALEEERLERDIKQTERRVRVVEEMAMDSDGAERERHRVTLREQLARLGELQEAQRQLQASPAPADPKSILEALDAKVDGLRHGLRQGGLAALSSVEDCLGGGRLKATRRADGRWDLAGEADPIRVFFGDSGVAGVGKKQKAAISGNVTGVTITPITGTSAGDSASASLSSPLPAASGAAASAPVSSAASPGTASASAGAGAAGSAAGVSPVTPLVATSPSHS